MLSTSLAILAMAFWGGTPAPCGTPQLKVDDLPGVTAAGYADRVRCQITLEPRLFKVRGLPCTVYMHEYGHLLGWQHSTDPNDLMYPSQDDTPKWPCVWSPPR